MYLRSCTKVAELRNLGHKIEADRIGKVRNKPVVVVRVSLPYTRRHLANFDQSTRVLVRVRTCQIRLQTWQTDFGSEICLNCALDELAEPQLKLKVWQRASK